MKKILFLLFLSFANNFLSAQISENGLPLSYKTSVSANNIGQLQLNAPDLEKIKAEDIARENQAKFYAIGRVIESNYSLTDNVNWQYTQNGKRFFLTQISIPTAKALSLYFQKFYLPKNASLFIYTPDKQQILGAYTARNNHESFTFSTELLKGETCLIEYSEDINNTDTPLLQLSGVSYNYRSVHFESSAERDFGDAQSCMINVNCPESNNYKKMKDAVVRIFVKEDIFTGWCSGALINNTSFDCTPYILSADHCAGFATDFDFNQWIFYFNYESPDCSNPLLQGTLHTKTINGCVKKSNSGSQGNSDSDFLLLKLNFSIPFTYNAFFAGWDRSTALTNSGVCIHHPNGDIKKISTVNSPPTITNWNFGPVANTHLQVNWAATQSGHSVVEGGSSGSPLFSSNGRIVGQLTGGGSACDKRFQPDLFGWMYHSWDKVNSSPNRQLKPWLDPDTIDVNFLNGEYAVNIPACEAVAVIPIENKTQYSRIFPNPISDEILHIEMFTTIKTLYIEIIDISGKSISALKNVSSNNGMITLPLHELKAGLYFINLSSDSFIETHKIIKTQ
jgi:hypothetical protein